MVESLGGKLLTIAGIGLTAFGVSFGLPIAIIPMATGCTLFAMGVFMGIRRRLRLGLLSSRHFTLLIWTAGSGGDGL